MNDISVEEVEDVIAIWKPMLVAYETLLNVLQEAKDKDPGKFKNMDPSKLAFDIVTGVANEYFVQMASSPSPW